MTRDPAAQAAHERLEHAVASMPAFDVEAGWAALAPQLESPIAPVIPLRPRSRHRMVALAVAAAVFIGGSALAAIRHGSAPGLSNAPVATLPGSAFVTGPHVHAAFTGAPSASDQTSGDGGGAGGGSGDEPSVSGSDGGSTSDSGSDGSTNSGGSGDTGSVPNQDAPDDIDHGTGNDGQHDDNGQGNDSQGQDSQGDGGQGGGSGGGSGSDDQGSGGQ